MRYLILALFSFFYLTATPVFADHHEKKCNCTKECKEQCAKGKKTKNCKCEHCDCAKGGKCEHCQHNHEEGKAEEKTEEKSEEKK